MDAIRALPPSTNAIFRPFVVLAAKCLGPGRLRLEMVKLAHDLNDVPASAYPLGGRDRIARDDQAIQPDQRAA
jgi:hypothetical protein